MVTTVEKQGSFIYAIIKNLRGTNNTHIHVGACVGENRVYPTTWIYRHGKFVNLF